MTKRTTTETAGQAYERNKSEALRRIEEIKQAILRGPDEVVNWGHVGNMAELVGNLQRAGHWAGVDRLIER
jgi:hypothetical protein